MCTALKRVGTVLTGLVPRSNSVSTALGRISTALDAKETSLESCGTTLNPLGTPLASTGTVLETMGTVLAGRVRRGSSVRTPLAGLGTPPMMTGWQP